MSSVVELVGQPLGLTERLESPIATWHYPEFRVYFEYDKVIHGVKILLLCLSTEVSAQELRLVSLTPAITQTLER